MQRIVTLTFNPAIDKSSATESVASEIKIRCKTPSYEPGGGGINVSRAIKNLGGETLAVYAAGGPPGIMLQKLLEQQGINQQPIAIQNWTRENLSIYEESSGLQYRFGLPGAEMTEAEWQRCLDAVFMAETDYIVASGSLPPAMPIDIYKQLAERAADVKARLIVDTSGDALAALKGAGVYLLKPNLRELQILSGEKFQGEDQLKHAAQKLISDGLTEIVVVSMGASGAALVTADDFVQMRPPVVPIESKVGAGDSMVGGIVMALARGDSLRDAVRYGIAAGTAAVMTPGTQLCRKEDTENIAKRISVFA
jgi:6-phosphofructokinase 2